MTRTEHDDWNIEQGLGATALALAVARAVETNSAHPLIKDEFAEKFLHAVAGDRLTLAEIIDNKYPVVSQVVDYLRQLVAVRTRIIDDIIEREVSGDIFQVVILGSGLDTRPYRLRYPGNSKIFEIDRGGVLEFKNQVLTNEKAQPHAERIALVADLRDNWIDQLLNQGFSTVEPAVWVTEGLLYYLPDDVRHQLFNDIIDNSGVGSRYVLDHYNLDVRSHIHVDPAEVAGYPDDIKRILTLNAVDLGYPEGYTDPSQYLIDLGWHVTKIDLAQAASQYKFNVKDPDALKGSVIEAS